MVDGRSKGRGFESQCPILFTLICGKIYCLFEKTKNKHTRRRGWPFLKKLEI